MKNVNNTCESNCCGCGACVQICPKKCITFIENERGFLVPKVDEEKCISCGLCKKVCPENNDVEVYSEEKKAYAAILNNKEEQKKSTSGGIFYALAEKILAEHGVVFGAAWKSKDSVSHIKVTQIMNLKLLSQSKYVQSNTEKTFCEAKEELSNNKKVLYSGTACQIAGLKKFLNKEYDNLYTVEVACHGVPSAGLFKKYINWREKENNSKIEEFCFRNRDKHPMGEHYKAKAKFENGKIKYYSTNKDPYYNAFLNGVTLRETCYKCKYKKDDRVADFTLCDFWGIEKEIKEFPAYYGCSAVLINSKKAKKLFEEISDKLIITECKRENVFIHNKSLISSSKKTNFDKFRNINDKDVLKKIKVKVNFKSRIKYWLKEFIPYNIMYRLRRLGRKKK